MYQYTIYLCKLIANAVFKIPGVGIVINSVFHRVILPVEGSMQSYGN